MKSIKATKPTDPKQWWEASCCGPLTIDINEMCGFCGDNHKECANKFSAFLKTATDPQLEGLNKSSFGYPPDDMEIPCGGSGFWCSGCGRFWAQDTCGNYNGSAFCSSDDQELKLNDDNVFCVCGKKLMIERELDNERSK